MRNSLLLALTALIWGVAFVAQSVGMEYVGPFTFNAVRSLIGGIVLIPCIFLLNSMSRKKDGVVSEEEIDRQSGQSGNGKAPHSRKKDLLIGGILCGIALCIASCLQQIGISYTTVGKAGFITAMYIVIVPVLGIFMKKKTGLLVWVSVFLAVAGLYFLCMTESLTISRGDLYVLVCAAVFSLHIMLIDYFSPKVDGVKLSCIQFLVCGILAGIPALIWEHPSVTAILSAWAPILYAGVLSCGVAYTLQIIGQKGMNPTVASLILSMESLFSVLAGWVILRQSLTVREGIGCALMMAAIVLVQLQPARARE